MVDAKSAAGARKRGFRASLTILADGVDLVELVEAMTSAPIGPPP